MALPFILPAVAAGVNAIGSAVGAAIGGNKSVHAQREANQGNMELAKYQYQANLEQWQRENEYNSPAAQMERYRQAGLNPHLIYGQQNTSAASPQYQAPTIQPADNGKYIQSGIESAANSVMSAIQLREQLRNNEVARSVQRTQVDAMQAQIALNNAKALSEESRKRGMDTSNTLASRILENQVEYSRERLNQIRLSQDVDREHIENLRAQRDYMAESVRQVWANIDISRRRLLLDRAEVAIHRRMQSLREREYIQWYDTRSPNGRTRQSILEGQAEMQDEQMAYLRGQLNYINKLRRKVSTEIDYNEWRNDNAPTEFIFDMIESGTRSFRNVIGSGESISSGFKNYKIGKSY